VPSRMQHLMSHPSAGSPPASGCSYVDAEPFFLVRGDRAPECTTMMAWNASLPVDCTSTLPAVNYAGVQTLLLDPALELTLTGRRGRAAVAATVATNRLDTPTRLCVPTTIAPRRQRVATTIAARWDGVPTTVTPRRQRVATAVTTGWDGVTTAVTTGWDGVTTAVTTHKLEIALQRVAAAVTTTHLMLRRAWHRIAAAIACCKRRRARSGQKKRAECDRPKCTHGPGNLLRVPPARPAWG
jgi:hypothetical protein